MEWIKTKDRLPEEPDWYDVKLSDGSESRVPFIRNTKNELSWLLLENPITDITHWKIKSKDFYCEDEINGFKDSNCISQCDNCKKDQPPK